MAKQKLNIHIHNPNTIDITSEYILQIFIEANKLRVDEILHEKS